MIYFGVLCFWVVGIWDYLGFVLFGVHGFLVVVSLPLVALVARDVVAASRHKLRKGISIPPIPRKEFEFLKFLGNLGRYVADAALTAQCVLIVF